MSKALNGAKDHGLTELDKVFAPLVDDVNEDVWELMGFDPIFSGGVPVVLPGALPGPPSPEPAAPTDPPPTEPNCTSPKASVVATLKVGSVIAAS
jgi:hypothetical protein